MRQLIKVELNDWTRRAKYGWRTKAGKLINAKMIRIVAESFDKFENQMKTAFVDRNDNKELQQFERVRFDTFVNILRDYDRISQKPTAQFISAILFEPSYGPTRT